MPKSHGQTLKSLSSKIGLKQHLRSQDEMTGVGWRGWRWGSYESGPSDLSVSKRKQKTIRSESGVGEQNTRVRREMMETANCREAE